MSEICDYRLQVNLASYVLLSRLEISNFGTRAVVIMIVREYTCQLGCSDTCIPRQRRGNSSVDNDLQGSGPLAQVTLSFVAITGIRAV